jgi:primase-polymerase (primpol)-like protein
MHVEASTQITHPFAKAENKYLLLFVIVKQEKYDSSSKKVKIVGFSVFNISRKYKFMLSCVHLQGHFKKRVSLKLMNTGVFIEKHRIFCKPGKVQKLVF